MAVEKHYDRDWLELPYDVTTSILYRVGVYDILENVQKVCTTWHTICKDPAMWRVINMDKMFDDGRIRPVMWKMCKHVVDRSQGRLVDITICNFFGEGLDEYMMLLEYIAQRSSQLRRLELAYWISAPEILLQLLPKFPLLEELSLYATSTSNEFIRIAGLFCPMLTTLKIIYRVGWHCGGGNTFAFAIGVNLPELRHLELIGDSMFMSNLGLQAILCGCRHLELLDLSHCYNININLKGEFGKKCLEKVKCVKLPGQSIEGCPHTKKDDDPIDDHAIYS